MNRSLRPARGQSSANRTTGFPKETSDGGRCRLPVRMDNRRAVLDMDVHEQRNAAVVHYKKCRQ